MIDNKTKSIIKSTVLSALFLGAPHMVLSCDYWASPNGAGTRSGLSPANSFQIVDFWPHAEPGKTLCLMDGEYRGRNSMINPTPDVDGTPGNPITIKALNDGEVYLNGEYQNITVRLSENDWLVIEGINAYQSQGTVFFMRESDNNIIRRCIGWDAKDGNNKIFQVATNSHDNLLEDVAGWGTARKTFSGFRSTNTVVRRAWGRWEGSVTEGPKLTYTLTYNNRNFTCENCIGTWSAIRMPREYTVMKYDLVTPMLRRDTGTPLHLTNYKVYYGVGIFGVDRIDEPNKRADAHLLGSIAYITDEDRFNSKYLNGFIKLEDITVKDYISVIETSGKYDNIDPGRFWSHPHLPDDLVAKNVTFAGGKAANPDFYGFGSTWEKTNVYKGEFLPSNVFTGGVGANVCYRYENRQLTYKPLWPWPMNERIKKAMVKSGRDEVDVTATIERLLGPIPPECRSTSSSVNRNPDHVAPQSEVERVYLSPNVWDTRNPSSPQKVQIKNLKPGYKVIIQTRFSIIQEWVADGETIEWDLSSLDKEQISSGTYFVVAIDQTGNQVAKKFVIIK